MTNPSNDELPLRFEAKEDGVWVHLPPEDHEWASINLGPTEQVMEAMAAFLAAHDFGE